MGQANRPERALVEAVAREEAARVGLSLEVFLNASSVVATGARRRAYRRIIELTGCSTYGLARVFGCDHGAVLDAFREPKPQRRKPAPSGFRKTNWPDRDLHAALGGLATIARIQREGFAR